jgi:hypothetical protein
MARKFHVEGTKTFIVLAIGLFVLGLMCLKDGWFPSELVQQKHPMWNEMGQRDHFYTFNRSLSVLSLIGSAICAYVHRVVR